MYRLMYSSVAATPLDDLELETLLGQARQHNRATGLTGLLLHVTAPEAGWGAFVQVLEGEPAEVERVYAAIARDELHTDLEVLARETVPGRSFAGWEMRLEQLPAVDLPGPDGPDPVARAAGLIRDRDVMDRLLGGYA